MVDQIVFYIEFLPLLTISSIDCEGKNLTFDLSYLCSIYIYCYIRLNCCICVGCSHSKWNVMLLNCNIPPLRLFFHSPPRGFQQNKNEEEGKEKNFLRTFLDRFWTLRKEEKYDEIYDSEKGKSSIILKCGGEMKKISKRDNIFPIHKT